MGQRCAVRAAFLLHDFVSALAALANQGAYSRTVRMAVKLDAISCE